MLGPYFQVGWPSQRSAGRSGISIAYTGGVPSQFAYFEQAREDDHSEHRGEQQWLLESADVSSGHGEKDLFIYAPAELAAAYGDPDYADSTVGWQVSM